MLRPGIFAILLSLIASTAAAQQQSLGIFGLWGAFASDGRCWAVAEPLRSPRGADAQPFVAVTHRQATGGAGQLHVRLSRAPRPGSAVLLRIDGQSFQLVARGRDAWAADARADAEIVAAMRTGLEMRVDTRAERGEAVRDPYRLRGAASAIDAAAIACRRA
jgi:hypothetical protein